LSAKDALCLEVASFSDPDHWRWRLTDARGKFLADHEVALDRAEAEYGAFMDLDSYCTVSEMALQRATLTRMASAETVQMKGVGCSL